jgi:hypothetical protein
MHLTRLLAWLSGYDAGCRNCWSGVQYPEWVRIFDAVSPVFIRYELLVAYGVGHLVANFRRRVWFAHNRLELGFRD